MIRRAFFTFPALTAAAWARYAEPYRFELTHTRVALPVARPLRLLHVADLHISDGLAEADLATGLQAGFDERPDLICLTGDFISHTRGFDRKGLIRLLQRSARTAPTFAVLGNHDGGAWLSRNGGNRSTAMMQDLVSSSGVTLLHNANTTVSGLTLAGVADLWSGDFDPETALRNTSPSAATILLCHNPDGKDLAAAYPWHLMLSGHTHGGQVRFLGAEPLWTPVSDKQFIAGLYHWNDRHLFITRGIGSPRHVRAFCRPEISMLQIEPLISAT